MTDNKNKNTISSEGCPEFMKEDDWNEEDILANSKATVTEDAKGVTLKPPVDEEPMVEESRHRSHDGRMTNNNKTSSEDGQGFIKDDANKDVFANEKATTSKDAKGVTSKPKLPVDGVPMVEVSGQRSYDDGKARKETANKSSKVESKGTEMGDKDYNIAARPTFRQIRRLRQQQEVESDEESMDDEDDEDRPGAVKVPGPGRASGPATVARMADHQMDADFTAEEQVITDIEMHETDITTCETMVEAQLAPDANLLIEQAVVDALAKKDAETVQAEVVDNATTTPWKRYLLLGAIITGAIVATLLLTGKDDQRSSGAPSEEVSSIAKTSAPTSRTIAPTAPTGNPTTSPTYVTYSQKLPVLCPENELNDFCDCGGDCVNIPSFCACSAGVASSCCDVDIGGNNLEDIVFCPGNELNEFCDCGDDCVKNPSFCACSAGVASSCCDVDIGGNNLEDIVFCPGNELNEFCDCGDDCVKNPSFCACSAGVASSCCDVDIGGNNLEDIVFCPGNELNGFCDCDGDCIHKTSFCSCDEAQTADCCGSNA